jgi:hypothetical protein
MVDKGWVTGKKKSGFSIGWNRDDMNRDDNNKKR